METERKSGGVGVLGLLLVGFILLKVAGVIDWNWLWVLSPFWIGLIAEMADSET